MVRGGYKVKIFCDAFPDIEARPSRFEPYFLKLADLAEECANDRGSCNSCPMLEQCQLWWDERVVGKPVTGHRFPSLASTLAGFRRKKVKRR